MNAPIVPQLSQMILGELLQFESDEKKRFVLESMQRDFVYMDYVVQLSLSGLGQTKQKIIQLETGYNFVMVSFSVQHDAPDAPPFIQLTDRKRQKQILAGSANQFGVNASASAGPGACRILTEGASIYWPFGELANLEFLAQSKKAGATKVTALVTGWKFRRVEK